jgi:very-short-patch-repair endonuclease
MAERLIGFARELRKNQTDAEKKIWRYLRSKQMNSLKFRRQQPIGNYIVDFVCFDIRLIIELDGSQHIEEKEKDEERDQWLKTQGFTVLRFWNNDVMNNIAGVLNVVNDYCCNCPPLTPPIKGGE